MNEKAQGALEYLLLIGGAVIVAAVVITLVSSIGTTGQQTTQARAVDAFCAPFLEQDCGVKDPDGPGSLTASACKKDLNGTKFLRCIGA